MDGEDDEKTKTYDEQEEVARKESEGAKDESKDIGDIYFEQSCIKDEGMELDEEPVAVDTVINKIEELDNGKFGESSDNDEQDVKRDNNNEKDGEGDEKDVEGGDIEVVGGNDNEDVEGVSDEEDVEGDDEEEVKDSDNNNDEKDVGADDNDVEDVKRDDNEAEDVEGDDDKEEREDDNVY